MPAAASLLLVVMPWRPALALLGALGLVAAVAIFVADAALCRPRSSPKEPGRPWRAARTARGRRFGFPVLLSIGMIDSATRMGFLIFLPFLLTAKGASLPTVGLALTLVFAGGAAGKLVCAFIGARIGVIATVWLTEGLTAAGDRGAAAAAARSRAGGAAGHRHRAQRHLVGAVRLGARAGRAAERRTRAFSIFYTGTIGSGAVAPALYGLVGDALGVPTALIVVAGDRAADAAAGARAQAGVGTSPVSRF